MIVCRLTVYSFAVFVLSSCSSDVIETPQTSGQYLEEFNKKGKPDTVKSMKWQYRDEMLPVKGWNEIVPGDGYAYLTIDANKENDRGEKRFPFQTISVSTVKPGSLIEMRAKGLAVSGVGGFIFTYTEADGVVDEIDIEIVPDDADTLPDGHSTTDNGGWTDARFNTWANADTVKLVPHTSHKKPVMGADHKKVSHDDDEFHIYTIEWRENQVRFLIDGVHQDTITDVIPDSPSNLIMGMRHMSWTGPLDWPGQKTMVIDWVRVTPLK